jgi:hypothetical protein
VSQTTLLRVRKTTKTSKTKNTVERLKKQKTMQPENAVGTDLRRGNGSCVDVAATGWLPERR